VVNSRAIVRTIECSLERKFPGHIGGLFLKPCPMNWGVRLSGREISRRSSGFLEIVQHSYVKPLMSAVLYPEVGLEVVGHFIYTQFSLTHLQTPSTRSDDLFLHMSL